MLLDRFSSRFGDLFLLAILCRYFLRIIDNYAAQNGFRFAHAMVGISRVRYEYRSVPDPGFC